MDKMSLFSILTVSMPEVILDIYLGFVLIGQRSRLYLDDKLNLLRLFIAVPLLVIAQVTARAVLPNLLFVLLANILFFIIILKFVYTLKWRESILSTLIIYGFLITVEATYVHQFAGFINKSAGTFFSNDIVRLLYSIPERIIQLIVIVSLWRWDIVYFNLLRNKKILYTFSLFAVLLFSAEVTFIYAFVHYIDKMSPAFRIACSIASVMFALINFLACKVIIMISQEKG
ncbi:MAG: hypothetical protein N3B21_17410 [Clostridia bacterium]|nr:hypothetical protein [Clostridia bacterium]